MISWRDLNISASECQHQVVSIQKQLKKFDNVRLRHLINLENEFSETKSMIKALSHKVEELSEPIENLKNALVSYPEKTFAQFCKTHQHFFPCPQNTELCEFILVEELKK